jgi:dTDP-4-dehydrorhamnose reductase
MTSDSRRDTGTSGTSQNVNGGRNLAKVIVLGASGMLGSMVLAVLSREKCLKIVATVRNLELKTDNGNVKWKKFDIDHFKDKELRSLTSGASYVVNCIGVIKPYIRDDNPTETERAIRVNSEFPYTLGRIAGENGVNVLQIATDCVYSGLKGRYLESDKHDPLDVYGKTKSLGEAYLPNVANLRCSIIGPEKKNYLSLLEWFLKQPKGAKVNGYVNHMWNGITTLQFGKICSGAILKNERLPHMHHIIPKDLVSKELMLRIFAKEYGRQDIQITPVQAPMVVDRTLSTSDPALNKRLWENAGYAEIPTVAGMISELASQK